MGVVDVPYAEGSQSTGDVAEILEAKYGIMQAFYDAHQSEIGELLTRTLQESLQTAAITGGQVTPMFAPATDRIKEMFDYFITSREAERVGIPGAPTAAALGGGSLRFKKTKELRSKVRKVRSRRPSFYDTGAYAAHFQCEVK